VAVGAFAIGVGAALVGASAAMGDPGPPSTAPSAPAPPTSSTGSGGPTTITTTTQPRPTDQTPPPRAHDLRVTAPNPGQIVLTWTLVRPTDIASVWVNRGPASRCPQVPVASPGFYAGTTIGPLARRLRQVDKSERDTKRYCYAVFTLDKAGNWAKPVTHLIRNPGDTIAPAAVTGLTTVFGKGGAVRLAWTNPPDAASDVVVRRRGSGCPHFATDGTRVGTRSLRRSEVDTSVPAPGKYEVKLINTGATVHDITFATGTGDDVVPLAAAGELDLALEHVARPWFRVRDLLDRHHVGEMLASQRLDDQLLVGITPRQQPRQDAHRPPRDAEARVDQLIFASGARR